MLRSTARRDLILRLHCQATNGLSGFKLRLRRMMEVKTCRPSLFMSVLMMPTWGKTVLISWPIIIMPPHTWRFSTVDSRLWLRSRNSTLGISFYNTGKTQSRHRVEMCGSHWVWRACLTTDLSMVSMQLWLMSSVVRFLHTGMTAVTGQPDSAPSASHCENSLASGTRIDCSLPERELVHDTQQHARTRTLQLGV